MNTTIKEKSLTTEKPRTKKRVALAIQGGGFPAGAFAAGVVKGLVEKGAFAEYDVCAFSGTSAGALVATVCWGNKLQGTVDQIPAALEYQWTYLNWPEHLAWLLVWTPTVAEGWREVDGLLMKLAIWRAFVERARTPLFRWIMAHWIGDTIPIKALNETLDNLATTPKAQIPGLALGAADVLKGEIKVFRERDLSLEALLASGSLDDCNGMTTIVTPPHEGTYLDGAWGDNPPINELLDYGLDEIWFIQHFPKTIPTVPRTPAERVARKDQLWQNSLVEHEREFVEFVNTWREAINGSVKREAEQVENAHSASETNQNFHDYLRDLYKKDGKLPDQLARIFDPQNDFAPKEYTDVKIKTIAMDVERPSGATIVNAPWVVRNFMDRGYEKACAFADSDFGKRPAKPGSLLPTRWTSIPGPLNDYLYGRAATSNALDMICDFCPKKAARTAANLLPNVLPRARNAANTFDRALCGVCLNMIASRALTGESLRVAQRW